LNVGIAIWQLAHMKNSGRVPVSLTRIGARMGFHRTTARRALLQLQNAGLATTENIEGRKPVVTLHWPPLSAHNHAATPIAWHRAGIEYCSLPTSVATQMSCSGFRTRT
jgi:hypothetical protein